MQTKIIECTNGEFNWGKFMIARFDTEWARRSKVATDVERPLLCQVGWSANHIVVFDLQTGESAIFLPGGNAHIDLERHKIWVCPLFEPFLEWLYHQDLADLQKLPDLLDLPDAPGALWGFRRSGSAKEEPDAASQS